MSIYRLLLLSLFIVCGVAGQQGLPEFMIREVPPQHHGWRINFRIPFGAEARFENLGDVQYPSDENIDFVFNNGYIDRTFADSDETSDFSFQMSQAEFNIDGFVTSAELTRFRTESLEPPATESSSASYGWEVAYQYEFGHRNDKLRWGLIVGFSFDRHAFSIERDVSGKFFQQTATLIDLADLQITYVPGGTYVGSANGPSVSFSDQILFDETSESPVFQEVIDGELVTVDGIIDTDLELKAQTFTMRVGPTMRYLMNERWRIEGGVGANLAWLSSKFRIREILVNTPVAFEQLDFEQNDEGEFVAGAFAELGVRYRISNRASAYVSGMYSSLAEGDTHQLDSVLYRADLSSVYGVVFGVKIHL